MEDDTYSISSSVIAVGIFSSKNLIIVLSGKRKNSKEIILQYTNL